MGVTSTIINFVVIHQVSMLIGDIIILVKDGDTADSGEIIGSAQRIAIFRGKQSRVGVDTIIPSVMNGSSPFTRLLKMKVVNAVHVRLLV